MLRQPPGTAAGEPVREHDFILITDRNSSYSFASPNGDPWYAERLLSAGEPVAHDFLFDLDRLSVDGGGRLSVDIWGVTDFPAAPDHHASFSQMSGSLISHLDGDWRVGRVYLGELGVEEARQRIVDTVEGGVGLTSFFGHSGPGVWTFDGLFATADAIDLGNEDPTVVVQWGCWNTYFVEPAFDTLAHGFLVSGPYGAAAVLGAGTLTTSSSEQLLGSQVLLAATRPGATLGQAVQGAKAQLIETSPDLLDVILGWNLLGDPALVLRP